MDTDLSHEALARFEHDEEHISDLDARVSALEGGGAEATETETFSFTTEAEDE